MFSSGPQPPVVSLFSSTGSDPLALFEIHVEKALPADSFVCLLDDTTSLPAPSPPATLVTPATLHTDSGDHDETKPSGYTLGQTVLHIQSPGLTSTYARCPPRTQSGSRNLGLKHPWMCVQVRDLGRQWAFEVGVVDKMGRQGVMRFSTFQNKPVLRNTKPPLLHLPLAFPQRTRHRLTQWSTVSVHLPSLIPHFTSSKLTYERDEDLADHVHSNGMVPQGTYDYVSYVKIYATCRLRRIWFSQMRPGGDNEPWELGVYSGV